MSSRLVWLFQEHRDAIARLADMQRQLDQQAYIIDDLEAQLRRRPVSDDLVDTMRKFQEEVLVEQPFPEGKIPDYLWLTPGDNDREDSRG